uniref:HNH endonuclease n=1 Tax=Paractinoplanes polyasparticus TaxID=2856853 RepID=UPI001C85CFFD|nr:HNH endonuclease [Actinoplanes polyasparticus]
MARTDRYQREYRIKQGHRPVGSLIMLTCACGSSFEHTVVVGRVAWKCRPCLDLAYVAKMRRDSEIRRLNAPPPDLNRTCIDCGDHFIQRRVVSPRVLRCRPCAAARAARLKRQYFTSLSSALSEVARVTFEIEGRWSSCTACGKRLACDRMGVLRKWCEKCLPVRKKAVLSAWKLANPEAWRAIIHRANQVRRAHLAGVEREPYDRFDIFARDKWICQICKKRISKKCRGTNRLAASIDHQIPLALGGPDTPANVVAAHFGCNSAKRSRYLPQGEQLALIG